MTSNILNQEFFLDYFRAAEKPRDQWKLGLEQEVMGYRWKTQERLNYKDHVLGLLHSFEDRFGWKGYYEKENLIGLKKDGSSITIEPGAQLELSMKPMATIGEIAAELQTYREQLAILTSETDWTWLSMGYDPICQPEQVQWVPKDRYRVMGEYLPGLGEGAWHMMKTTCTAQSNLDYSSEADMVAKLRATTALAPYVNILFATSPFCGGQPSGCKSRRGWAWRHMSPQHSGFLDFIFDEGFGYQQYIDYIINVPMLVLERDGQVIDTRGLDFKQFMNEGFNGLSPAAVDWKVQLGATFPVARLRNAIETRTADAGPVPLLLGQAAFWKGLVYDQTSLDRANALIEKMGPGFFKSLHQEAYCQGFDYLKQHAETEWILGDLLEWSQAGLERLGADEAKYLEPVHRIFERKESIADRLLAGVAQGRPLLELFEEEAVVFV
ncbi:MAG: glutamate-cysteine ligase family protein [bacterium]|nr:glutamate-cysteine ligase family protein [bacterium]